MVRPGAPVGPQTATTLPRRSGAGGATGGAAPGGIAIEVDGSAYARRDRCPVADASSAAARTASASTDATTSTARVVGQHLLEAERCAAAPRPRRSPRGTTPTGTTPAVTQAIDGVGVEPAQPRGQQRDPPLTGRGDGQHVHDVDAAPHDLDRDTDRARTP